MEGEDGVELSVVSVDEVELKVEVEEGVGIVAAAEVVLEVEEAADNDSNRSCQCWRFTVMLSKNV